MVAFIMFFIIECGLYYQAFYSTQTFNDEISSNFSLYESENICSNIDDEIIEMVEDKAKRYFGQDIKLNFIQTSADSVLIQSENQYLKKHILNLKISCDENYRFSTKTNYLFVGPFLFRMGQMLKSTSSMHNPKF